MSPSVLLGRCLVTSFLTATGVLDVMERVPLLGGGRCLTCPDEVSLVGGVMVDDQVSS